MLAEVAEVAEAAMMQAEAGTQPDDPAVAVDSATETDGVPMGHILKKIAVEAGGMECVLVAQTGRIDDHENTAIADRATICAVDDPLGGAESRHQSCSEAQGSRTTHQNNDLLQQMTMVCATVQNLGKQMQDVQNLGKQMHDGLAAERIRRQED